MSVEMKIIGLEKFRNGLKDLPQKVAKRAMLKAVKYAAFVLEEEIKIRVPVNKGDLRDSIVSKSRSISPFEAAYRVQSNEKNSNNKPTWYGPLVEYGHNYVIKRGKKVVAHGYIAPQPFFRPAFDAQKENMQQVMVTEISEAVAKEWRKLSARG